MFLKVLISVLVFLNIKLISAAPDSVRSSADDAKQAFNDLAELNNQLLQTAIANMEQTVLADLKTFIIDKAVNYIYTDTHSKVNQTKLTISKNLQTLENFGLDSSVCKGTVFDQLDDFANEIRDRVVACGSTAGEILDHWLNKTSREMPELLGSSVLSCHARDLSQCMSYAIEDSCYDAVIEGMEKAKSTLSLNYQIATTAFFTKIADYKLPCQDLLNYEVAHFLSYRLKVVRNCIQVQLKLAQQSSCNLS